MKLSQSNISDLNINLFNLLSQNWALLSAGTKSSYNTMTISWGGLGVLWNKNVAHVYVRPGRFTYEFCEREDMFSISFPDESAKDDMKILGSISGRDCDKLARTNQRMDIFNNVPYIADSHLVLICKKLYHSDLDPSNFNEPEQIEKLYPKKDYHRMYVAEIVTVLKRD